MSYLTLKTIHISCAVVTITLFVLRGIWMMRDSPLLHQRWVRIMPHANDSILLGSAVAMAFMSAQYPWNHAWLGAKIAALLVYIGLGMVAIRHGRSKTIRITAWFMSIAVFAYIVSVAVARDPFPL